jgi:hypothetical protein
MQRNEVTIRDAGGNRIGAIVFDENPPSLCVTPTAGGINLGIPAGVELEWRDREEPRPTLMNLRVDIYFREPSGSDVQLCRIRDDEYYEAASPLSDVPANLVWTDALRALILIERRRSGKRPQLNVTVRGELSYIVMCAQTPGPQDTRITIRPLRYEIRTAPRVRIVEQTTVSYPLDVWEKMIQTALELSRDDPYLLSLPLQQFLKRR